MHPHQGQGADGGQGGSSGLGSRSGALESRCTLLRVPWDSGGGALGDTSSSGKVGRVRRTRELIKEAWKDCL